MNALRAIHAVLVPEGIVVDTQPISEQPVVESDAGELGSLDLREWGALIREIDGRIGEAVAAGLFAIEHESHFTVADGFADGEECLACASQWVGTRIPPAVRRRVARASGPVRVHQQVRMRLLRRQAGR